MEAERQRKEEEKENWPNREQRLTNTQRRQKDSACTGQY